MALEMNALSVISGRSSEDHAEPTIGEPSLFLPRSLSRLRRHTVLPPPAELVDAGQSAIPMARSLAQALPGSVNVRA